MTNNIKENIHKGVSIIICTYNGKQRLPETLRHIVLQNIDIPCEVILIDNASTDGTKQEADRWWGTYGLHSTITYQSYSQPKPGKSYAQELGYDKAQYSLLLVCDDDNWLCNNYVQTAFDIMESNIEIGALGGWCDAVFESEHPVWFQQYVKYYAVGKQAENSGDVTEQTGYLYGAGMVIRKAHWRELLHLGFQHILSCRKGDTLSSGGDTEYCFALRLLGYKIWYDERLHFKHFMTLGRLNLAYLTRLRQAMTYSNFVILAYRDVLYKQVMSRALQRRRVLGLLQAGFFKNIIRFVFGTYEQKEVGRTYFKRLYYLCFCYEHYLKHVTIIEQWVSRHRSKILGYE